MTHRRQLSWSSAVQTLRADRAPVAGLHAHLAAKGFAKIAADRARLSARTAPLVVAGQYDRSAIMKAAIVAAQARKATTGEAWGICLSAALKGTWQVAKAARLAVAH